jgi:3-deoxy-7-phosphoheptulonate synthase
MVEVHGRPEEALCDGDQSETPEMFYRMVQEVRAVAGCGGQERVTLICRFSLRCGRPGD